MGGHAFADDEVPLSTPRMPSAVYIYARDGILTTLRTFYAQAECPIEAAGKTDYGDVDILVARPLHDFGTEQLAAAIGAVRHKKTAGSQTTHFAVPWPKPQQPAHEDSISETASPAGSLADDEEQRYIQLDLHLCSPESFAWEVFHQAHGDFWNIIGSTVRRLGLTPTNSGLYIRIGELEARNKAAARVLLTNSPAETLRFFGLDERRYWQRFETVDGLFAYAATCRFFDPNHFDPTRARSDLKANDRARARKRMVFRKWIDDYLPAHARDPPADPAAAAMSREEVVDEAKSWFGVADEYEQRRRNGLKAIRKESLVAEIRKNLGVEEADSVGPVMRGVKRELLGDEGQQQQQQQQQQQREADMAAVYRAYLADDFDAVVKWVRDHWREIEERQRAHEKEQSTKNLLAKLDRMRLEGKADGTTRLGRTQKKKVTDDGECPDTS